MFLSCLNLWFYCDWCVLSCHFILPWFCKVSFVCGRPISVFIDFIFIARRYASAVLAVVVCLCVCLSVCLSVHHNSQAGIVHVTTGLNIWLCKQHHTIAQGLDQHLQWKTNRKSYGLSNGSNGIDLDWLWRSFTRCGAFKMQFLDDLCSIIQDFKRHSASRGPSAIAGLLVLLEHGQIQTDKITDATAGHFTHVASYCGVSRLLNLLKGKITSVTLFVR